MRPDNMPTKPSVSFKEEEGIYYILLKGMLSGNFSDIFDNQVIKAALENQCETIILDLKEVLYLDSTVLGKIMALHVKMNTNGRTLQVKFNERLRHIIDTFNLNNILNII